jgi:prepilin-type N-terminal cleavage/methylation domain-containing protein/prepilin-type processing-associated H-X9-DG protein
MRRPKLGFTLIELLVVVAVVAILASLLMPALARAKSKSHQILCTGNLKQWALAMQMYAAENDDFLPKEGFQNSQGWYITLPEMLGMQRYTNMPWRTNAGAPLGRSIWICPSNTNRSNGINLFHYCLNKHLDGTGEDDQPRRLSAVENQSAAVWLFDNGKRAAVAQQNNVHTNVHSHGANFSFVDGHVAWFRNSTYWDFKQNKGLTNNPQLVWASQ